MMCVDRPLILITNDDGIKSPGLLAAAEALLPLGDLLICAPDKQQTSMGRSFPREEDLGVIERYKLMIEGNSTQCYGVHGSPAYAVAHAILEVCDRKPDICVSGINYGENLGYTITCSGTLGAAFEANTHGIPAIAVSLQTNMELQRSVCYSDMDWRASKSVIYKWTKHVLEYGMPDNVDTLNINIPAGLDNYEAYRVTRQSRQNYYNFIKPERRDFSVPFELKSTLKVDMNTLERDSDIYTMYIDGITSVTPLSIIMSVDIDLRSLSND